MQHLFRAGCGGGIVALAAWPAQAFAHGFAIRYDLPLPLGFFLSGAGATVALSFLLLALFAKEAPAHAAFPPAHLASPTIGRMLSKRWLTGALQSISVALFLLVIATALFGDTDPFKNISTTMVWLIWWVGMMFINTFIGDVWAVINPDCRSIVPTQNGLAYGRRWRCFSSSRGWKSSRAKVKTCAYSGRSS